MRRIFSLARSGPLPLAAGVAVAMFFVVALAQAATTISTNVDTGGTLAVTGLSSLANASTTSHVSIAGALWVGGNATTTAAGAISTQSTLDVTGATTLASTTATTFKIGQTGTQHSVIVSGFCSFGNVTLAASSTDGFASCTVDSSATGKLVAGDRVFVQATSSLEAPFLITAASTTGISTIQLRFLNTGLGLADGTLSGTSVNFWAVR